MTLNNDFFRIQAHDESESGFSYSIALNRDHFIYRAHFPGEPITPGVCIVQVATELLEEHYGFRLYLTDVVNAKFLEVINPTESNLLEYRFTKILRDADLLKVSVTVSHGECTYSKLSLKYKINDR